MPTDKKPTLISTIVELDLQSLTWGDLRAIVAASKDSDDDPAVFSFEERTAQLVGIYVNLEI